jgi:hypothetical protein
MKRVLLLAFLLATPTAAFAADAGDTAIHDYVLSMDKVRAYDAGALALAAATQSDSALRVERAKMNREPDGTYADLLAKMDNHPRVYAFFQKQGLSKADAALIPLTLLSACSIAGEPQLATGMTSTVSAQQVDFCKTNQSELQGSPILSTGQ